VIVSAKLLRTFEVALDQLLDPTLLRDIPILSIGISLFKFGNNIQTHLLTKKICACLCELEVVPVEKHQELRSKMINKERFSSKVGK
jgi:hypothetical protein